MTLGLYGTKLGMTQVYDEDGLVIPVTVIKLEKLTVTQVKTKKSDGYDAVQVGFSECKKKKLTKSQIGHLENNKLKLYRELKEFKVANPEEYKVGQEIDYSVLENVQKVDITGKSIGKGFQGTIKLHNFSRGPMTHGSKNHRLPGSIGAGTTPGRVYKGKKMAANMGNKQVTVTKLKVVKVDAERDILLVKGSVPGTEGKMIRIMPSRTKWN